MHSHQSTAAIAVFCVGLFLGSVCLAYDEDPSEKGCGNPADIVFVLDESGSIWGPHFTKQLEFVEHVVDTFDVRPGKTHIGVLTFGTDVRVIFNVGQIRGEDELKAAIKAIRQMRGETYTHEALRRTRVEMFSGAHTRPDVPHIVIVITDGESNFPDRTAAEAELAHGAGLQIFAIGVGQQVNRQELEAIASEPDMVFQVDDYTVLDGLRQRLAWRACQVTTLPPPTTTTTAPPPPQMIEGCTNGYRAMDHIWAIPDQADAAQNAQALDLIRDVTSKMTLSPAQVQVGLTPRVCQAGPAIRLRDHDTQETFYAALNRRLLSSEANTSAHIQYIHNTGMSAAAGGRAGSVKFGLLIVDSAHGSNLARATSEARRAKDAGIRLIVIGVGQGVVTSELNAIASSSQDVITVDSYSELTSAGSAILGRLCHGLLGGGNQMRQRYLFNKRFLDLDDY
jgi:collagen type VI alpha